MSRYLHVGYGSWFLGLLALTAIASLPPMARAQDEAAAGDIIDDEQDNELTTRAAKFEALAKEVADLEKHSNVLKKVVKLVSPNVVHIEADKFEQPTSRVGRRAQIEEAGSGCIVKLGEHFYVLTNRHVVKNAALKDIKIKLNDGRLITPTKVWSDRETDVAVLAISAPRLVAARIGNSDETEIGDFVLAVGSPFGLSHSVTFGIISAKGRRDLELGEDGVRYQDFMQTDAAINPGNSGGPLINLRGELIGLNTAIASSSGGNEGIGFTIPSNMVMIIAKQLVERGSVTRAFLGVALNSKFGPAVATSVGLLRPRGTQITKITPGSPAEVAKLQTGDVILEYNGNRVDDDSHLINMVSLTEVGKEVPVVILRDHKVITVKVKVGQAPPARATKTE
jgi:serine protease Do